MGASTGDISMRSIRSSLAILAVLALAACYPPTTDHPIGTTTGLKPDPLLEGTWKATEPDPKEHKVAYYHFLPDKDGTITAILVPDKGAPSDLLMVRLTTAHLGKSGFMNVRLLDGIKTEAKDQPSGTLPILYLFDGPNTLRFTMLDEDRVKDAIKAHKVAGGPSPYDKNDIVITADGPALDKFFQSAAGLALFTKTFAVLHRLN
jgi:hypothetical protein